MQNQHFGQNGSHKAGREKVIHINLEPDFAGACSGYISILVSEIK